MHFNSLFKYISNKEAWFYAQFDEFAARGNLFPLRFFISRVATAGCVEHLETLGIDTCVEITSSIYFM